MQQEFFILSPQRKRNKKSGRTKLGLRFGLPLKLLASKKV